MNQIAPRETSINSVSVSSGANGTSIAPQNLGEVVRFAEVMCKADIALPKHLRGNAGACMAVAMQALEWQMSPFAVASKSYAVNGAIAYEAQLIAAVVNTRTGIKGRLKYLFEGEGALMTCTVTGTLDGEDCVYTSPTIGSITTKNSPLWKSDPQQQLGYFSARSWARRHCPEVLLGVYDRDEAEQFQGADNAKDVTPKPSIMERLSQPKEAQGEQEGFSAANVTRETETLTGEQEQQNTSVDSPQDTDVPGEVEPSSLSQSNPADEADHGKGAELETSAGTAPDPVDESDHDFDEADWLKSFAKMIVAAIGPDEAVIVDVSKGQFVDGLSEDARARAKTIVNYARQACRGEIEPDDAKEIIAGKARMESVKELV